MASLPQTAPRFSTGLVLGKFHPLTRGHQFLIDTAAARCDTLFIAVSGRPDEAIPQSTRAAWIRQLYPRAIVVEQPQTLPYYPDECPSESAFYDIWIPELIRVCNRRPPDALFSSEDYGHITAKLLHCTHVLVDPDRQTIPVSATRVRQNPFACWEFMHPIVRAHYVKTITILGPESTGKTTLCQTLAAHFNTVWQLEWARAYLGDRHCNYDDMEIIATHHGLAHTALRPQANKLLFQDTNAITTKIFSDHYYQNSPNLVRQLADQSATTTAHFLLTDIDVPWRPDTSRDLGSPAQRQLMRHRHLHELTTRNLSFTLIQGDWHTRLQTAINAVNKAMQCNTSQPFVKSQPE